MTIDTSLITDTVLLRLRETWTMGDGRIPPGAQGAYGVLDLISGGGSDGDMEFPERDCHLVYRITSVSRDPDGAVSADGARAQAEHISRRFHATMLDRSLPLEGVDWRVVGREHAAFGGVIREGTVVSIVNDYALWAVAFEPAV